MRKRAPLLLFPVLLLAIFVGYYWKLTLSRQFTWMEHPDAAYQVLPWLQVQAKAWHEGIFPAWEPGLYGGQPLVGQAQPGAVYPLNWILFLLPLRDGFIRLGFLQWYFVLIHFMAGAFCYWLCRDLKRSQAASLLGGIAYGLGGAMGALGWPQMLNGAVWTPLVVMFLLRAVRGRRPWSSAALSGICLGLNWLSGHHQIPIFVTLAVAGVWTAVVFKKGAPDWRVARLAAVGFAFAFLTGAMQILPGIEYGKHSVRWAAPGPPLAWGEPIPYIVHREYAAPPASLIGIVIPGISEGTNPYMGFVIVALAAFAIAVRWRQLQVRLFAGVALVGIFLALGSYSLLHGLLYALVPMVEKGREASMAVVVLNFGVAVLAAYGVDSIALRRAAPWRRRMSLALAVTGGLILFAALMFIVGRKMDLSFDGRVTLAGFLAILAAAGMWGLRSRAACGAYAIVLALMELSNWTSFALTHRLEENRAVFLKRLKENSDVIQFVKQLPGAFRIELDDEVIPYNLGDWQAMDVYNGNSPSMPSAMWRLEPHVRQVRAIYGVRYTLRRSPNAPGQREVFQGASGLKVYENEWALPRVWPVHEVRTVGASVDDARRALRDPAIDPRKTVFLRGEAPRLESCETDGETRLVERGLNRVVIDAQLGCRGMVIFSDNWYPGWRATVDGVPAEIHAAYTAVRGVVVEGGRHRIEMRYRPWPLLVGALLSALAVLAAGGLAWWERRGFGLT